MKFEKTTRGYRLTMHQLFPLSPGELFPFFSDARNLQAITPKWLNFQVLTPGPIDLRVGVEIDYKLRLRGLPIRWRTKIIEWDPPHGFVDEQIKGPYKRWHHEHTFAAQDDGTLATDRVDYSPYGGPLAPLVHKLVHKRDIRAIFAHRTRVLAEKFGGPGEVP